MANPRNIVSFEEIDVQYRAFKIDGVTITFDKTKSYGSDQAGKKLAVTLSADGTVALCADGDPIIGRLERVEGDNKATVAVNGCLGFLKGNGATVTRGAAIVGALGASSAKGYIRDAASGTAAELVKCRGVIYDVSSDTNVVVEL
ncbi:MAG: hypothetical protein AB7U82_27615 [Blastocatellales bacterium]